MQTDLADVPKEELDIMLQQIYAEAHKRSIHIQIVAVSCMINQIDCILNWYNNTIHN